MYLVSTDAKRKRKETKEQLKKERKVVSILHKDSCGYSPPESHTHLAIFGFSVRVRGGM